MSLPPCTISIEVSPEKELYLVYDIVAITVTARCNSMKKNTVIHLIDHLIPKGFALLEYKINRSFLSDNDYNIIKNELELVKQGHKNSIEHDVMLKFNEYIEIELKTIAIEPIEDSGYQVFCQYSIDEEKRETSSIYTTLDVSWGEKRNLEIPNIIVNMETNDTALKHNSIMRLGVNINSRSDSLIKIIELRNVINPDIVDSINFDRRSVYYIPITGSFIITEELSTNDRIGFNAQIRLKDCDGFAKINAIGRTNMEINPKCYVMDNRNIVYFNPSTVLTRTIDFSVEANILFSFTIKVDGKTFHGNKITFTRNEEKKITFIVELFCGSFKSVKIKNIVPFSFNAALQRSIAGVSIATVRQTEPWYIIIDRLSKGEPLEIPLTVVASESSVNGSVMPKLEIFSRSYDLYRERIIFEVKEAPEIKSEATYQERKKHTEKKEEKGIIAWLKKLFSK